MHSEFFFGVAEKSSKYIPHKKSPKTLARGTSMFPYRRVITHETPSALVSALGPSNTAVRTVVVVAHLKKLRRPRTGSVVAVSRRAPGSRRQVSASYTVTSGRSAVFGVGKSAAWTAQSGLASRGSDPRGLYLWFIPFES